MLKQKQKSLVASILVLALVLPLAKAVPVLAEGEENITFSEVMYDLPGGDNNREWVEIYNTGEQAVELSSDTWRFNDGANHALRLVQGDWNLEPGEAVVVTSNDQTILAEHQNYEGTVIDTVMGLNNASATLSLSVDNGQNFFTSLSYQSEWGGAGNGKTLEKIDPAEANEQANWQESQVDGGTPGAVEVPEEEEEERELLEQTIVLSAGWNIVSSYIIPEDNNIDSVLASLIEANVLESVKDQQGRFNVPGRIHQIQNWNSDEAYQVRVSRPISLIISGYERISPQIELSAGWNLVAYPFSRQYEVRSLTNQCLSAGELGIVKNNYGQFYVPAFNFSNILGFLPGQGYFMKVTQDAVLDWSCLE
ncbi:MAG: lamin tail domain-containing protein [Syntrophales bacterium]|nr:lamin tail domain-containing protein [Syntrophales bacterium]